VAGEAKLLNPPRHFWDTKKPLGEQVAHSGGKIMGKRGPAGGQPTLANARRRLDVGCGLFQTLDAVADLPLAPLAQKFYALKALEYVALNYDATRALETVVLRHDGKGSGV